MKKIVRWIVLITIILFTLIVVPNSSSNEINEIEGGVMVICNGYRFPLSRKYDPYAQIILQDIDTGTKQVYFPDNGKFSFPFSGGRYLIKPWYNSEWVGFRYVDKPQRNIEILIVECDLDAKK